MVKTEDGEGKVCREEKRVTLGKVVVPGVSSIVDGERAGEVEVEKPEGWESPLLVVKSIGNG